MNRKKKVLVGCVGVLLVLFIAGAVHHFRVKGAVERYKVGLARKGEPMHWEEVLALRPMTPENSASLFLSLSARLPRSGPLATNQPSAMETVQPGRAITGWAQPWFGELRDKRTNSWSDALVDYESQRALLHAFRQLIAQPNIDHNLDFGQGFNLLLPHLAPAKMCALRLGSASTCELHRGSPTEAELHVRAMVALARGMTQEPLLITQLVRIAIAAIACSYTWDLLQARDLNEADLRLLQDDWSKLEFLSAMEQALLMERCLSLQTIQLMRDSPDEFRNITSWMGGAFVTGGGTPGPGSGDFFSWAVDTTGKAWERTKMGLAEGTWRLSWSYTDELGMLKGQQALLDVVRLAIKDGFASNAIQLECQMREDGLIPAAPDSLVPTGAGDEVEELRRMFSDGVRAYDRALDKAFKAQAIATMAVTAIALERYRLRHGNHPKVLADLVPTLLTAIPRDPMDGSPLRYQCLAGDRYLLYSVGVDLRDNGGNPNRPDDDRGSSKGWGWESGRDWVWPHQASQSELEAYWQNEIKAASAEQSNAAELASKWAEQYYRHALTGAANKVNPHTP